MIATAKTSASIHPLLKQLHVFDDTINVLPPNKEAKRGRCRDDGPGIYPLIAFPDPVPLRRTANTSLGSNQR